MIRGIIQNNQPLILITVVWRGSIQKVVALIDTGFTGDLKLPPEQAKELGLRITHTEPVVLANQQIMGMSVALAYVTMENTKNLVEVLIGNGMPIIGVGLLKRFGYLLNINFRFNTLTLKK